MVQCLSCKFLNFENVSMFYIYHFRLEQFTTNNMKCTIRFKGVFLSDLLWFLFRGILCERRCKGTSLKASWIHQEGSCHLNQHNRMSWWSLWMSFREHVLQVSIGTIWMLPSTRSSMLCWSCALLSKWIYLWIRYAYFLKIYKVLHLKNFSWPNT